MTKRSSSPVEQLLAQLEYLGNNQLKQLLVDLESKKQQLPVEDHAIIDWGINTLKAKILDEERLVNETDQKWKEFREMTSTKFIKKYRLARLNLATGAGRYNLYSACYSELREILKLALPRTYRESDFKAAIRTFKRNLRRILRAQHQEQWYQKYIQDLRNNFAKNYKTSKYFDVYEKFLGFLINA